MTEDGALKSFKTIGNYATAPCPLQKEVAAHNSVYDTLKKKKEVVYKAPCEVAPELAAPTGEKKQKTVKPS